MPFCSWIARFTKSNNYLTCFKRKPVQVDHHETIVGWVINNLWVKFASRNTEWLRQVAERAKKQLLLRDGIVYVNS